MGIGNIVGAKLYKISKFYWNHSCLFIGNIVGAKL